MADQHFLGGEQLVFRLAGIDEDRDAAAFDQAFGKRCRQMRAKTHFRPGRDDTDQAALIGKHAARQVVDVVAEFLRRLQHLFARCRRHAGTRREGARHGGARNPANCATCSALTKRMRSFFGVLPPSTGPSFIGFQLFIVFDSRMTAIAWQ